MARITRAEREMDQLLQLAGLRDELRKSTAERDQLRADVERLRGEIQARDVALSATSAAVRDDEKRRWKASVDNTTARAEYAEGRAAGLYSALCDAVRASGGVANDGISDTFLIIGVPAEMAARKKAQEAAERERDELQALIDMQHSRVVTATRLWREAHPGNDLVMPDLGRLIDWLILRSDDAQAHASDLRGVLREAESFVGRTPKSVESMAVYGRISATLARTPAQSLAKKGEPNGN